MSTKKTKKENVTTKVNHAFETAKSSIKKANDYALKTTEEVVSESITAASEWQKVTDKALKGGIQLLDNQQNLIFDTLETYKSHFMNGKERLKKVFA